MGRAQKIQQRCVPDLAKHCCCLNDLITPYDDNADDSSCGGNLSARCEAIRNLDTNQTGTREDRKSDSWNPEKARPVQRSNVESKQANGVSYIFLSFLDELI